MVPVAIFDQGKGVAELGVRRPGGGIESYQVSFGSGELPAQLLVGCGRGGAGPGNTRRLATAGHGSQRSSTEQH